MEQEIADTLVRMCKIALAKAEEAAEIVRKLTEENKKLKGDIENET